MSVNFGKGRTRSTRSEIEDAELLQKELAALSAEEREALEIALQEVLSGRNEPKLYKAISDAEWVRTPVDMETFIKDPYFLGNTCDMLYPKLQDDLTELFSDGTYREAIFTGAIGWGKTFTASIGICRMLYELSCMRDPHRSFGIAANSNISIVCLSVNEMLATKVAYENIANKIEASPYFQEHFPFSKTKKELRFPSKIWVAARATTDNSVLGLNVIGGLLDETNFMAKKHSADPRFNIEGQAEVLYNAMQRRMRSRFERKGKLPGILFVVSSKQTSEDFTAKRVRDSKGDPTLFVRDYSLWDVKPSVHYSGDWFHIVVGNESSPSRVLKPDEDPAVIDRTLPEGCLLVEVPIEYKNDFDRDIDGSIRDLAGIATVSVSPYIQRRDKIEECIHTDRGHPYSTESWDPSQPGYFNWPAMVSQQVVRDYDSFTPVLRPILNPHAPRHIHVDPSLTGDCTGLCMAHVGGWTEVERRAHDGGRYYERAPLIVIDFVLRIIPPIGDEILFGDVRRLIYQLSEHGYMITKVTMDSWQSAEGIQKLSQKGYDSEVLSIDRTMAPYEALKSSIYENRLNMYPYAPLLRELRELEHDRVKRKVDHPARGSKDCSDALAGVVWTLTESNHQQPVPFVKSSPAYGGDAWLTEQMQASEASRFRQELIQGGPQGPMESHELPPFIAGSSGTYGWDE